MGFTREQLKQLDEIFAKDNTEWTAEEIDLVVEWRVHNNLSSEKYETEISAIQEYLLEAAEAHYDNYIIARDTLSELKNKAFELLERASV